MVLSDMILSDVRSRVEGSGLNQSFNENGDGIVHVPHSVQHSVMVGLCDPFMDSRGWVGQPLLRS